MIDNIIDKAKEAAKDAVSNVSDQIISFKDNYFGDEQNEISEDFKDAESGKVKEIIDSINESMSLITSSGYEFKGIGVSLGLVPSVSLSFHYIRDITGEEQESLLEQAKDKKIIKIILKMLFKAGDFYRSIKLGNYVLDAVNMNLGLSLGMSLTFKKLS